MTFLFQFDYSTGVTNYIAVQNLIKHLLKIYTLMKKLDKMKIN